MYQRVTIDDFHRAFVDFGREANFSYSGRVELFEHLTWLEQELGQPYELDVIALCCEFTEYESIDELAEAYDGETARDIEEHTTVLYPSDTDSIIIANF